MSTRDFDVQFSLVYGNSASLGFEPRQRDPESLVLPLHHEATSGKLKAICLPASQVTATLRRDLRGWSFRAERDLGAFPSSFHFQRLPAFCHQCASVFHHFIDHLVVMVRIMMEQQELAHVRIKRQ